MDLTCVKKLTYVRLSIDIYLIHLSENVLSFIILLILFITICSITAAGFENINDNLSSISEWITSLIPKNNNLA
ncbi:hypothetical protein BpHYR1_001283 [Brachionus plicatilis]|uniref:Uncharacterized protein n=1 Tax=Brachionus plicatilis TaxID=10195 RepID=A0A3M7P797_BRAPC|nr:hypothetical protein BpHYR1_001283 [Brachionus plicatilis]